MFARVKLVLFGVLLATAPLLLAFRSAPQDATPRERDPFHEAAVWNFAKLQYATAVGQMVEVEANTIRKMWIVHTGEGRLRLEVLYRNDDYSSISPGNFHIIARSPGSAATDVPIIRTSLMGMAFPDITKK